jgi:hypothetical protein
MQVHQRGDFIWIDKGRNIFVQDCSCGWEYISGVIGEDDEYDSGKYFVAAWKGMRAYRDHFGEMAAQAALAPSSRVCWGT